MEELQKPRFTKGEPHESWGPRPCCRHEFRRMDIACKSSAKQSELTQNSWIWQAMAFTKMMRKVSKSCRNLVLQRGGPYYYMALDCLALDWQGISIGWNSAKSSSIMGDHMVHAVPPLHNEVSATLRNFRDHVSKGQKLINAAFLC